MENGPLKDETYGERCTVGKKKEGPPCAGEKKRGHRRAMEEKQIIHSEKGGERSESLGDSPSGQSRILCLQSRCFRNKEQEDLLNKTSKRSPPYGSKKKRETNVLGRQNIKNKGTPNLWDGNHVFKETLSKTQRIFGPDAARRST